MSHITLQPASWRWKALDTPSDPRADLALSSWTPCSQFPTEIHLEHLRAGLIPHPYKGRNEHEIQWISEKSWLFSAVVEVQPGELEGRKAAELVFEGLDTFVTVWWNGEVVLEGSNHFMKYKVTLGRASRGGGGAKPSRQIPLDVAKIKAKNELLLLFKPPWPVAKALEAEHGKASLKLHPFPTGPLTPRTQLVGGSCNLGDPARLYIRKAQYHARWDWGPEIMCMGPDRPVHLHMYKRRLGEVWTKAIVSEHLQSSLEVDIGAIGGEATVRCSLRSMEGETVREETVQPGKACVKWDLADKVDLWWPNGQGPATRYRVDAELLSEVSSAYPALYMR